MCEVARDENALSGSIIILVFGIYQERQSALLYLDEVDRSFCRRKPAKKNLSGTRRK